MLISEKNLYIFVSMRTLIWHMSVGQLSGGIDIVRNESSQSALINKCLACAIFRS